MADVAVADRSPAPDAHAARYISILGHELRGGLATVIAAVELLGTSRPDPVKTRSAYEMAKRQLDGMTRIVNDLLEVALQRRDSVSLNREMVAVADVIERSTETVRAFIAARDHTLAIRISPEPIFVYADVMWLAQALQNLLINAAKYTKPGGRVSIDVERDGNDVVLSVSDTGVGIEAAELEGIFDAYAQIDAAAGASRHGHGLGLGLYLARLLIAAHGGTIHATSSGLGRGSEFIVRLPCRPRSCDA